MPILGEGDVGNFSAELGEDCGSDVTLRLVVAATGVSAEVVGTMVVAVIVLVIDVFRFASRVPIWVVHVLDPILVRWDMAVCTASSLASVVVGVLVVIMMLLDLGPLLWIL